MLRALFWISSGLIGFTHFGYAAVLWVLRRAGVATAGNAAPDEGADWTAPLPAVSLVISAYNEEDVIAAKVANAFALEYPRERLEVIVASDGSDDLTVEHAREAGADLVLDLPRGGKSLTQNAAAERASGEILAFSDANAFWHPDALHRLVEAFRDPDVAYACGEVRFLAPGGDNQEGAYWRYEMAVRRLESDLGGVTAGNGGIYAVRAADYLPLGPAGSHDLSFPFLLAKRGRRSVFVPEAAAEERMVPSIEGEWSRKRRMMIGIWDIVVGEGMIRPGGYPPLFGFQVYAHRVVRYLTPVLHVLALAANLGLVMRPSGPGRRVYAAALSVQAAVLGAAALARSVPRAPFRLCRYYVLMTASIAAGVWDRLRGGKPAGAWEKSEGTR